jgi:hypothetical protein
MVTGENPRQLNSKKGQAMCFVLMPFAADFDALYENAIRPAAEATQGLTCLRADEIYGPRPIMADIWKSITEAAILIADLTGRNPNVLYELGLAHAQSKPVVLITQDINDVPFDLRAIRCVVYVNTRAGRAVLKEHLKRTLKNVAIDIRRQSVQALQEYTVLPALNGGSVSGVIAAQELLQSKDPWEIVALLRRKSEQLKKRKKGVVAQNEIEPILALLNGQPDEVTLAALKFLQDHVDRANLPSIYPLLDSVSVVIQREAVKIFKFRCDVSEELLLLDKLQSSDIPQAVEEALIDALISFHGDMTVDYCSAVLRKKEIGGRAFRSAFEIMRSVCLWSHSHRRLLHLVVDGEIIKNLPVDSRIAMIDAFWNIESSDVRLDPNIRSCATRLLKLLCDDPHPRVRGKIAALWIRFSQKQFGGLVSRSEGWELPKDCGREALEEFIEAFGEYEDGVELAPEEGVKLVKLVEGDPLSEENIVFMLRKAKAPGVEDFMLRFVDPDEGSAIWALAYFADCPSGKAVQACERVLAHKRADISEKVLAAMCQAKLGDKSKIEFVVQNISKAHKWIGVMARPLLESIATKGSKTGRLVRQLLKDIPESW